MSDLIPEIVFLKHFLDSVITHTRKLWFIQSLPHTHKNKLALKSFSSVPLAKFAKSLQSCLTLCDPIDGSPQGSPIPGILQARTLEWVAISFSNVWKWKVKVKSLSRVGLSVTPWIAAYQDPPTMGFSRQKYWSGVPLPSPSVPLVMSNSVLPLGLQHDRLPCPSPTLRACSDSSPLSQWSLCIIIGV